MHEGDAVLESVFGRLAVTAGDYVVIPASTTHRWVVDDARRAVHHLCALVTCACPIAISTRTASSSKARRSASATSARRSPSRSLAEGEEVPVLVRTRTGLSTHVHATHPFDVVGWDGYLYPWALSIHDFEPIVGRIHQPPPVHQTFAGPNFVICSFVPRLFDFDPSAVKVPYHHSNVDSDEVLFYSRGNFMSRAGSGIGAGSISLHPPGFVHGPQPGSRERSEGVDRTEEVAVMCDTFRPLALSDAALAVSDPDYPFSWSR